MVEICEQKDLRVQKLTSRKTGGLSVCFCPSVKRTPRSDVGKSAGNILVALIDHILLLLLIFELYLSTLCPP